MADEPTTEFDRLQAQTETGDTRDPVSEPTDATTNRQGVVVSMYVEGAEAARMYGMNARELGCYIMGYWFRHLHAIPEGYEWQKGCVDLRVRVPRSALGGIAAILLPIGCAIDTVMNDGDELTLRIT